ncbi:MAG: hypothetical protein ACQUYJ_19415 [Ferruginibacter sp.]
MILSAVSCFEILGIGDNSVLKEVYNSQGSKKAILFSKEGNATVDLSLQVTVTGYDYKLSEKETGNTFTVDSDHNAAKQDTGSIDFNWLSNDSLQIEYDNKLRVFIQQMKIDDVTILYKKR